MQADSSKKRGEEKKKGKGRREKACHCLPSHFPPLQGREKKERGEEEGPTIIFSPLRGGWEEGEGRGKVEVPSALSPPLKGEKGVEKKEGKRDPNLAGDGAVLLFSKKKRGGGKKKKKGGTGPPSRLPSSLPRNSREKERRKKRGRIAQGNFIIENP